MTFVSESGLYSLIFRSRKPEALNFQRWITREVIPSIRKHGGYFGPGVGIGPPVPLPRTLSDDEIEFFRKDVRKLPPGRDTKEMASRYRDEIKRLRLENLELKIRIETEKDSPVRTYVPDEGEDIEGSLLLTRANYEEWCMELRWQLRDMMRLIADLGDSQSQTARRKLERHARIASLYSGKPAELYVKWHDDDLSTRRIPREWLPLDEPLPEMYDPLRPRTIYIG
jgi:hypothetical protein